MPWMRRVWVRRLGWLAWIQGLRLSAARRLPGRRQRYGS